MKYCPSGYSSITTVNDCATAAQYLKMDLGDGNLVSVNNSAGNVSKFIDWLRTREICPTCPAGAGKPFGCFSQESERLVGGRQQVVTTLAINHNLAQSGAQEGSAPICILNPTCKPNSQYNAVTQENEQLRKDSEIKAESPIRTDAINWFTLMMFMMFVPALAVMARRSVQDRRQAHEESTFTGLPSSERDSHVMTGDVEIQGDMEPLMLLR
jgi:hypothetical protein